MSSVLRVMLTLSVVANALQMAQAQGWSEPAERVVKNVGYVKPTIAINNFQFYSKQKDNDFVHVIETADGRLQLFYRSNRDGHLWTQCQTDANAYGSWTPPHRISDDVDYIGLGRNKDGRLQVFMRSRNDEHLYTRWQKSPTDYKDWSGPSQRVSADVDHFVVASNADGRLQVLMRGKDGHLYTRWQTSPNAVDGWNDSSHRVSNDIADDPGAIAVAQNADGRLQVFMRGSKDGQLYTRWQNAANAVNGWNDSSHRVSGDVTNVIAARNADGRLQVFMRGSRDGHLYTRWQTTPNGVNTWNDSPHRVSDDVHGIMAVILKPNGQLQVFMRGGRDDHLYTRWQKHKNTVDSWTDSSERVTDDICTVAVGRNKDGKLQVFVMGDNDGRELGHLYTRWQK